MISKLNERTGLTITFNTTEDCNLACKYCYEVGKRPRTMELSTAKKFIDIILAEDDVCNIDGLDGWDKDWLYDAITLDFIGGDSLMDPKLLDSILTYWVSKVNTTNTPNAIRWRRNWKASISSNGTLFGNPEVRAMLEDWAPVISLGVSIDGCPEIHDKNRIYKDGRPSMPEILKWWDWYKATFPFDSLRTKATCSKDSIPYLEKSLRFLYEQLEMRWIHQNFIFEDTGCKDDDYQELRHQMEQCILYVYENRNDLYWSMIDKENFAMAKRSTGGDWELKGHCGGGIMPALGVDGKIYPCFRFLPHTQEQESPLVCGDVEHGLYNKKAFSDVTTAAIRKNCTKKQECMNCEYESACAYCIAGCYSEYGEFKRQTYICQITQIQVEFAKKYWSMIEGEGRHE